MIIGLQSWMAEQLPLTLMAMRNKVWWRSDDRARPVAVSVLDTEWQHIVKQVELKLDSGQVAHYESLLFRAYLRSDKTKCSSFFEWCLRLNWTVRAQTLKLLIQR